MDAGHLRPGHAMRGGYGNIVGLLEKRFKTKMFVVIAPTNHELEAAKTEYRRVAPWMQACGSGATEGRASPWS